MKKILFKVKDNRLNIIVDHNLTNKEFIECLKNRLEKLIVLRNSITKEVVLNIENRNLDNREILQLFDVLEDNKFYLSKVLCQSKQKDSLMIYKGNIRGGQIRFFDKSVLLIGSVNKSSKIVLEGNLYVLGVVNGDIELKNKKSRIYCQSISSGCIKIGDIYKTYNEKMDSKEIYLDSGEIKERDYRKEEMNNVKSNSCYIG